MASTMATTPRGRALISAGSACLSMGETQWLGPGGCPYEATMPKWATVKKTGPTIPEARPLIVFVLGGPGSGKDAQCARIQNQFKYVHIHMGEVLRRERELRSDLGALLDEHIMQGQPVPAELTVQVLIRALESQSDWKRGKFLIDGFPRNVEQMDAFNKTMADIVTIKTCLFFDASQVTLEKRLLALADAENAGDDATLDAIQKRVLSWQDRGQAVQRYFQYEGLLERVDANRDVQKVWTDVQQFFIVEAYNDVGDPGPTNGSPAKAIWKLREKQVEEIFPTGHSHTSVSYHKGDHARQFTSYQILARHRDKHTRNMKCPTENYLNPPTLAQEIGWHQPDDKEEHIGAKGTPRGGTTPRSFYPRNTCAMTRHMENMYSTNAQHIIRRW